MLLVRHAVCPFQSQENRIRPLTSSSVTGFIADKRDGDGWRLY
jgi:hypothetical protein